MSKATWWQRSALVLVAAVGLCGSAMAQTIGVITGTGSYNASSGSWSFNGAFNFDTAQQPIPAIYGGGTTSLAQQMGETPNATQFQFQANSASNQAIVDGAGYNNPTHSVSTIAPWQILNTTAGAPNSTLYGPAATFAFSPSSSSITGSLTTDTFIHWYCGYDNYTCPPSQANPLGGQGKTSFAGFGWSSELSFSGDRTVTSTNADGSTNFNFTATVAAVPEPETYAMLLAGLGLVGVVVRRRTQGSSLA